MGGCITPPTKKSKLPAATNPNKKPSVQADILNTTLDDLKNPNSINAKPSSTNLNNIAPVKSKYKKITSSQFNRIYRI